MDARIRTLVPQKPAFTFSFVAHGAHRDVSLPFRRVQQPPYSPPIRFEDGRYSGER